MANAKTNNQEAGSFLMIFSNSNSHKTTIRSTENNFTFSYAAFDIISLLSSLGIAIPITGRGYVFTP